MNFFLQTLTAIFRACIFFIKGDEKANGYVQISEAHWLLSWLMMIAGAAVYLLYLPTVYTSGFTQEILPEAASYSSFKSANMISLIFVLFAGYLIVYLLAKPLAYAGNIRRYIILQNWVFLFSILILVPISLSVTSQDSPLISLFIFIFMFMLFFAYRTIKLTLGINGPKAFLVLLILLVFELTMDEKINVWFGLVKTSV